MSEDGRDTPRVFEAAGSPKTSSPEVQLNQLVSTVDRTDQAYEGKVVTRIPTEDGKEVFIFNSIVLTPEGAKHPEIAYLGVHPKDGPILVATGALSELIDQEKKKAKAGEERTTKWEQMLQESEKRGNIGNELGILTPDQQQTWNQTFYNSVEQAKRTLETEAKLARVLPASLDAVMRIAQEVNIPPEQRNPPEFAADDPNRGVQVEKPAHLRPAPEQQPGTN